MKYGVLLMLRYRKEAAGPLVCRIWPIIIRV